MKIRILGAVLAPAMALSLGACTVDQTREGEAPEIDVEAGTLPEYEVRPADVDVGWDTTQVRTPTLDVTPRDTLDGR
jgi:hypothetical protein